MEKTSEAFRDGCMVAVDALRLFTHNILHADATASATIVGQDGGRKDLIHFRGVQCWGDLTRTADGIILSIHPIHDKAPGFISRRFNIERAQFPSSFMMTAGKQEFRKMGGLPYLRKIAQSLSQHFTATMITAPIKWQGADCLLIANYSTQDKAQTELCDHLGIAIAGKLASDNLAVFIRHPAFDSAGGTTLIDRNDMQHQLPLDDPRADDVRELERQVAKLPLSLNLSVQNLAFPPTYRIRPNAFSLAAPERSRAMVAEIIANASLAANSLASEVLRPYQVTIIFPKSDADPLQEAERIILDDWESIPGADIRPQVLSSKIEFEGPDHFEVTLRILADRDAAESYNEVGRFDVLPV